MSEPQTIDAVETPLSFGDFRLSAPSLTVLAGMGITSPTPIQAEVLPLLLDGRDVIGQARTGSGKTLAFALPMIEVVDPRLKAIQALVLTPTRELAVQVAGVIDELGKPRGVKTLMISGGRAFGPQRDELRRGVHVVVGTPGRVLDLLNQGALWLDRVRFLVLDEADEMLDRGFAPDVERIIARTTPDRQTALFSATVPAWVRQTAHKHLHDAETVMIAPEPGELTQIEHLAFDLGNADKLQVLEDLLDHRGDGSVIVFGRTKHGVNKLARRLQASGYPVAALQGNLSQNARDRVMDDFRNGQVPILVATNVAARGLDVSHVAQVINVELPESPELDVLLGLYQGIPLTERGSSHGNHLPDLITLFQKTIEEEADGDEDAIIGEIGETLIHELGHYFGMSEDEIMEIEDRYWRGEPDPEDEDEGGESAPKEEPRG